MISSDWNVVGWTNEAKEGDEVSIEANIWNREREQRRIQFLINGKRENVVIVGVPESIIFGVCLIPLSFFIHLPYFCEGYSK